MITYALTPESAAQLCADIARVPPDGPLAVGDPRIMDYLAAVSRRLLDPALVRRHPELAPLGFFLRPAETRQILRGLETPGAVRVPQGLVFHIPPANVDTVFVYSWALSALTGNRNIVRLSPRSGPAATAAIEVLADALVDAHPAVAQTQRVVSYGRSDEITAALSAACDLRVIWGGDEAVRQIRRHPLTPHARDLTFPDRSSFTVISTSVWHNASDAVRDRVARDFANDAYWFDQAACSSPRTVFWLTPPEPADPTTSAPGMGAATTDTTTATADTAAATGMGAAAADTAAAAAAAAAVKDDFTRRLAAAVTSGDWTVDPAMAVEQRVSTYGLAAAALADNLQFSGTAVASYDLPADLPPAAALPRRWLGLGVFAHCVLASLDDLVPVVTRKDQTMTHFGLTEPQLRGFAEAVAGRGVDRIVPIGSALAFAATWDGIHLPSAFSRLVTIQAGAKTVGGGV
ncbi:gamma-glutamyl phosphate reductase [Streptosporangiaceae bacterium NEAU-GS5]|nr:gamma-glutamyl phosphate reductase [Streptosporangiaceae bacterium NEAU-GS5]